MVFDDNYFMREALKQAELALKKNEVPVGAVIVAGHSIIARAHNMTETLQDVTAHAEILAITSASGHLGAKYLTECRLYVTLEPCLMCASALAWAQIGTIIYGASDPKKGFTRHQISVLHPKTKCSGGLLAEESAAFLQGFFMKKRKL